MNNATPRIPYHYDVEQASFDSGVTCPPEEDRTQQQFAEEVDINTIVRRFGLTGELPINPHPPLSGDFTDVVDFSTAMQAVRTAQEGFNAFPAELRARFNHDPQRMLEFLSDSSNLPEAIKLGLISKPVEVVPSTPPTGVASAAPTQ